MHQCMIDREGLAVICTSGIVVSRHRVAFPTVDDFHSGPDVSAVVRHHVELHVYSAHCQILVVGVDLVKR